MTLVVSLTHSDVAALFGDIALSYADGIDPELSLPIRTNNSLAIKPTSIGSIQKTAIIGPYAIGWAGNPAVAGSAIDTLKTLHDTGHLNLRAVKTELSRSSRYRDSDATGFILHSIADQRVCSEIIAPELASDSVISQSNFKAIGSGTLAARNIAGIANSTCVQFRQCQVHGNCNRRASLEIKSLSVIGHLLAEDFFVSQHIKSTFGGLYDLVLPRVDDDVLLGFEKLSAVTFVLWPFQKDKGIRPSPAAVCVQRYRGDILTYESVVMLPNAPPTHRIGSVRPIDRLPANEEARIEDWLLSQDANPSTFCHTFVNVSDGATTSIVGNVDSGMRGVLLVRLENNSKIAVYVADGFLDSVKDHVLRQLG